MRNQNGIDLAIGGRPKIRQSILALLLGMHAAIEDNSLLPRFEIVTVGADLGPTRQVDELQNRAGACQSRVHEQSANFVRGRKGNAKANPGGILRHAALKSSDIERGALSWVEVRL